MRFGWRVEHSEPVTAPCATRIGEVCACGIGMRLRAIKGRVVGRTSDPPIHPPVLPHAH